MLGVISSDPKRNKAPRRSHHKSRQGCLNCKRRRVKCDESGPPCTNCKYRQTRCEYDNPAARASHVAPVPTTSYPGSASRESSHEICGREAVMSPERRRSIELRLLHRWSTVTYDSIATEVTNDWEIWQKTVPEVALKYDFLLNIIFALAAFDIAYYRLENATEYLNVALEYQGLAFRSFRSHLQSLKTASSDVLDFEESERRKQVTTSLAKYVHAEESRIVQKNVQTLGIKLDGEEHDALLYASLLLLGLTMASATARSPSIAGVERDSTIQQTIGYYDLLCSISAVIMSKPDCITTHQLFRDIPQVYVPEVVALEDDVEWYMTVLSRLNDDRAVIDHTCVSGATQASRPDATQNKEKTDNDPDRKSNAFDDIKKLADELDVEPGPNPHYSACRNALVFLKYMFQTCHDEKFQAHCLGWLNMAGDAYILAVKDGDRIALMILLGWAVLMQPLGEILWYGKDFGKLLVDDVVEALGRDDDEQVLSVFGWAKRRTNQSGSNGDFPNL